MFSRKGGREGFWKFSQFLAPPPQDALEVMGVPNNKGVDTITKEVDTITKEVHTITKKEEEDMNPSFLEMFSFLSPKYIIG